MAVAMLMASTAYSAETNMSQYSGKNNMNAMTESSSNMSDSALANKVRDALKGGFMSRGYADINVDVSGGVITLSGDTSSESDHKKILERVQKVDGAHRIIDHIQIK